MFANDVMIFLKPRLRDLHTCASLLMIFGESSGLKVNMTKSAALPIRCTVEEMQLVSQVLHCPTSTFPCKNLGLPLTLRKQSAAQLSGMVDHLAASLPRWKAANMPKSGRMLLVTSVLSAMPLHAMMALDIPMKTIKAMVKICRSFLWCAKDEANGGQCRVAWEEVCTPRWAGGLGIPNLKWLNIAMQARWPWLKKTDPTRPWAEFEIAVPDEAKQLCKAATLTSVGNGNGALFWEDKWIQGSCVEDLAPNLYSYVHQRIRAMRSVAQGMTDGRWALDIGPDVNEQTLREYLHLWNLLETVHLQPDVEDSHHWAWDKSGQFTTRSAYAARFWGREVVPTANFTWSNKAPLRCRFFTWLALRNRCWTSDRLARRGLDHQERCPFCDQHQETMTHIMLQCVFSREVWTKVCSALNNPGWSPTATSTLVEWCKDKSGGTLSRKDTRAVLILVVWELWKHRNGIVFESLVPSVGHVIHRVVSEGRAWRAAGLLKESVDACLAALSVGTIENT